MFKLGGLKMKVIWNNKIVDHEEVVINPEDRGYQFGDGVYEVIRAYNHIYFCLDEHINRLYSSAKKIELTIPNSKEEIKTLANQLLKESNISTGDLYLQITRGISSPRNHTYPDVAVLPLLTGKANEIIRNTDKLAKGIKTSIEEDIRWLRCDIKMISLLGNIMLKHEAHKKGAEEAILHREGIITEGSSSNVGIVKDGVIYTHPDNNFILPGITKLVLKRCAQSLGIPMSEESFTLDDLKEADEVFCTSTTLEIMPVNQVDNWTYSVTEDSIVRTLQRAYEKEIEQQCGPLK